MVGMVVGGGLLFLPLMGWPLYRIYQIVRFPDTLDAFIGKTSVKVLRTIGIFLMGVGLIGSLSILFIKPLTLAIAGQPGENGIAFFVVGVFLYFISAMGWVGMILFEVSRDMGKNEKRRKNDAG